MGLQFEKPESRAKHSRSAKLAKALHWRLIRREVLDRDGYRCRCCGTRDQVDVHHIRFRSVGGGDSLRNCAAFCRSCHSEIHAYRLAVVGDNANRKLRFVRRES